MQERDQGRLTRIFKRDRCTILPQIAADFNAETSTSATVRTIQQKIIDMGFRSSRTTLAPLMPARNKDLRHARARQHRHWIADYWKQVT
ncbi:HTH_Tnp_Tc3_2 domain-containing protein [Trichonephila clavipes]|nr:HTH_Tnp_Tc3_2 domain-containing protein [Trichonephila clavipes]